MYLGRHAVLSCVQHAGPEQRMEVGNVLADEVVNFAVRVSPPVRQLFTIGLTPFPGAGDVANWCIKPDIPVVARGIWYLKSKIGGRPTDIPVSQFLSEKVPFQIIGNFALQCTTRFNPVIQKGMKLF